MAKNLRVTTYDDGESVPNTKVDVARGKMKEGGTAPCGSVIAMR